MPENTHYIEVNKLPDRIVALTTSELDLMRREYVSAELYESAYAMNDAWQAENAKLRELIKKYMSAARYLCKHKGGCDTCNLDCASYFGADPHGWDCARVLLDSDARELGIEVDYGQQRDV